MKVTTIQEQLAQLKADGLTFGDCIRAFSEEGDQALIKQAQEQWGAEGELEIDDATIVSQSDNGAYVMAWVWIDDIHKQTDS